MQLNVLLMDSPGFEYKATSLTGELYNPLTKGSDSKHNLEL